MTTTNDPIAAQERRFAEARERVRTLEKAKAQTIQALDEEIRLASTEAAVQHRTLQELTANRQRLAEQTRANPGRVQTGQTGLISTTTTATTGRAAT